MPKLIHQTIIGNAPAIELWKAGRNLEVRYGHPANTKFGLTYAQAAREYGAAVFHAIQCETGALDGTR